MVCGAVVRRFRLCRCIVLLRLRLRRSALSAAAGAALFLRLGSGLFALGLCSAGCQRGLYLFADACGSLFAQRICAGRRMGIDTRLVALEAGIRVAAAASAARGAAAALAGARCGGLCLLLELLLGGLFAARRALCGGTGLTRLFLGFLFAGSVCGDLLGGGVLGYGLAAGTLVFRLAPRGVALLLGFFLVRDLTGDWDTLADQLLDVLEVRALGAVAERMAVPSCPALPVRPMR